MLPTISNNLQSNIQHFPTFSPASTKGRDLPLAGASRQCQPVLQPPTLQPPVQLQHLLQAVQPDLVLEGERRPVAQMGPLRPKQVKVCGSPARGTNTCQQLWRCAGDAQGRPRGVRENRDQAYLVEGWCGAPGSNIFQHLPTIPDIFQLPRAALCPDVGE